MNRIRGGNAQKLCEAFGKEEAVGDVDKILRKAVIISGEERALDLPLFEALKRAGLTRRYEALLEAPSILFASDRHEALARALGIRPCWVAGLDYNGIHPNTLECYLEFDEDDPSLEEAQSMLRKTAVEEDN